MDRQRFWDGSAGLLPTSDQLSRGATWTALILREVAPQAWSAGPRRDIWPPDSPLCSTEKVRNHHIRDLCCRGYALLGAAALSHAGDRAIPGGFPVRVTLDPGGSGDDTARVQAAVERAARDGGGAVVLRPGIYRLAGTVRLNRSGVVLHGSGSKTVLSGTGKPHTLVAIGGSGLNGLSCGSAAMPSRSTYHSHRRWKVHTRTLRCGRINSRAASENRGWKPWPPPAVRSSMAVITSTSRWSLEQLKERHATGHSA